VTGDKRAALARRTPQGRAAFAALAEQHEAWVDGLLSALDDTEAAALIALLDKALEAQDAG